MKISITEESQNCDEIPTVNCLRDIIRIVNQTICHFCTLIWRKVNAEHAAFNEELQSDRLAVLLDSVEVDYQSLIS